MGKKFLFAIMAIVTIVAMATGCTEKEEVRDIRKIVPVDTLLKKSIPLDKFYKGTPEEKKSFVEVYKRQLTANTYAFTYIRNAESMEILVASGSAQKVSSGDKDKKYYDVTFEDEILIVTSGLSGADTTFVFTGSSGNNFKLQKKQSFGHGENWRFEIGQGQTLKDYIDSIEKWEATDIEKSSYQMPGLGDKSFSEFLKENQKFIKPGDVIDCLDKRVLNTETKDVVNFKKRGKK